MKVERRMKVDVELFEVGDIINFKLIDGEKVQAMAVKQTSDGILFVLVDCLAYATSDLRKALNGEILERFPKKIKDRMVAVNVEGDMLRIPTECEVFGENFYGRKESKFTKRWKPMKKKRNRVASQGKEGPWEWYWLINRHKEYATIFTNVGGGEVIYESAISSNGVRPVFMLKNAV